MISPIQADLTLLLFALGMRDISVAEMPELFETIASRGLDTQTTYSRGVYKGLSTAEAHYRKHAIDQGEWPPGATYADYIATAASAVLNPRWVFSALYKSRHWQVAFVSSASDFLVEPKFPFIVVEYRLGYGHWTTAHLVDTPTLGQIVNHADRSRVRWLRQ